MTAKAGAPSVCTLTWDAIDWQSVVAHVRQLQMRIAKAFQEGKHGKVKALQWTLTHSFYAKLLSVKRVTQNRGARTPGVDKVLWKTPSQRMQAALTLKRRGYQPQPLKRIYIPKKQKGNLRSLSIPSMSCRAQQALYLLSLEPIAELRADKNAYGFRPLRSTADAIEQCFNSLAKKRSAQYVLEGDIRACFDSISSQWLMDNIPMDKVMLGKWLTAGYMDKGKLHPTDMGTPQGGIISPTLLTITLSGLEQAVKAATKRQDKVNVCAYADDFIITGATQDVLEYKVKPAVEAFLNERGLSLSQEKTKIVHIDEGFDFLGMNVRKYHGKLLIKPAKSSVKRFLTAIREIIKLNATARTENLITQLNPKVRGWSNYYRHVVAKKTFSHVDANIFHALWRWAKRRHPKKSTRWVKDTYFRRHKLKNWQFFAKVKDKQGQIAHLQLVEASKTPIRRHIKIRAEATPFDAAYHGYFNQRFLKRLRDKDSGAGFEWWLCWWNLLSPTQMKETGKIRVANSGLIKA